MQTKYMDTIVANPVYLTWTGFMLLQLERWLRFLFFHTTITVVVRARQAVQIAFEADTAVYVSTQSRATEDHSNVVHPKFRVAVERLRDRDAAVTCSLSSVRSDKAVIG